MKLFRTLLLLTILTASDLWSAKAQGSFLFRNRFPPGNSAPVFDTDCQTPLAGDAFVAQAYVGDTPQALAPLEPIAHFSTGGFLDRIYTIEVPGLGNRQVYVQMRVWEIAAGSTFEQAVASGGKYGVSNITPVMAWVNSAGDPDTTDEFVSFCLVPEPSTVTLGVIGACALGIVALGRQRGS